MEENENLIHYIYSLINILPTSGMEIRIPIIYLENKS